MLFEADYARRRKMVVAADYHACGLKMGSLAARKDESLIAVGGYRIEDDQRRQCSKKAPAHSIGAQDKQKREVPMCRVFAGQDPEGYRQINRSIRIDGHSTSIQLEATFWGLLDEIADSQGLTTPKFISKLYDEAIEINGQIPNFASMLRTTCALYLRGHRPSAEEQAALKREAA